MPTEKQLAANRRNAQKSTGPQTADGKSRAALNALKSGIYAESLLLPGEKLEDLRTLIDEYYLCYTPRTPAARNAVDNLIRAEWLARRLSRIDTQILAHEIGDLWKPVAGVTEGQAFSKSRPTMQRIQQRITATDHLYHRNLKLLQTLQPDLDPESDSPSESDLSTTEPTDLTAETEELALFQKPVPKTVSSSQNTHPQHPHLKPVLTPESLHPAEIDSQP